MLIVELRWMGGFLVYDGIGNSRSPHFFWRGGRASEGGQSADAEHRGSPPVNAGSKVQSLDKRWIVGVRIPQPVGECPMPSRAPPIPPPSEAYELAHAVPTWCPTKLICCTLLRSDHGIGPPESGPRDHHHFCQGRKNISAALRYSIPNHLHDRVTKKLNTSPELLTHDTRIPFSVTSPQGSAALTRPNNAPYPDK